MKLMSYFRMLRVFGLVPCTFPDFHLSYRWRQYSVFVVIFTQLLRAYTIFYRICFSDVRSSLPNVLTLVTYFSLIASQICFVTGLLFRQHHSIAEVLAHPCVQNINFKPYSFFIILANWVLRCTSRPITQCLTPKGFATFPCISLTLAKAFSGIPIEMNIILFGRLVQSVGRGFDDINSNLIKLSFACKVAVIHNNDLRASRIRRLHEQYASLTKQLENILYMMEWQLTAWLLFLYLRSGTIVFNLFAIHNTLLPMLLRTHIFTVVCFFGMSLSEIFRPGHTATHKANDSWLCLQKLSSDPSLSLRERQEIKQFSCTLILNKVKISIFDVMDINYRYFCDMIVVLISYLVILLQFQWSESDDESFSSTIHI